MAEGYSVLLVRMVRGEESLATTFWLTLLMLAAYFCYETYVPSLSDVFNPLYHGFRIFLLTFTLVAIHNACHDSALFWRLLARTYVLLLLGFCTWTVHLFYGPGWAIAYPLLATGAVFVVKD